MNLSSENFKKARSNGWNIPDVDSLIPRISSPFLPSFDQVFAAFELIAPSEVEYVVIGQDPYFKTFRGGTPLATGLAFGVPEGCTDQELPQSLIRILPFANCADDRTLSNWARTKKILLLNAALTVPLDKTPSRKQAGMHIRNWSKFTAGVIRFLLEQSREPGNSVTFVCWGVPARKIAEKTGVPSENIAWSYHPTASKSGNGSFKEFWQSPIGLRLAMPDAPPPA
jgi:uracil DNA glycosylase